MRSIVTFERWRRLDAVMRACSDPPPTHDAVNQDGLIGAPRVPASRPVCDLRGGGSVRARKSRISAAISVACVSSAKCPVSSKCTSALGLSRLYACAPAGRKNRIVASPNGKQRCPLRPEVRLKLRINRSRHWTNGIRTCACVSEERLRHRHLDRRKSKSEPLAALGARIAPTLRTPSPRHRLSASLSQFQRPDLTD